MGRGTQAPWTNPDLQRLFKAWRDGEEIDVICARFGRTERQGTSRCVDTSSRSRSCKISTSGCENLRQYC